MAVSHPATTGHGHSAPDACSVLWDGDGTSAYGTAARATWFVVLEQPGPWGRVAATESHLNPDVGARLEALCAQSGGRFMLMRRPGAHADRPDTHEVLVAWAGVRPGDAWAIRGRAERPELLLQLDGAAIAAGDRESVLAQLPDAVAGGPTLLVCTNGRRDVCCALRGRPVAAAAAEAWPGGVWEVSHTGGHRFAPTAVLLPWGQTLARLDAATARDVTVAAREGRLPADLLGARHDRGRSALPPASQAAESHVRGLAGETSLAALWADAPVGDDSGWTVPVHHVDGRRWSVRVVRRDVGLTRPESCGKAPVTAHEYAVEDVGPGTVASPSGRGGVTA